MSHGPSGPETAFNRFCLTGRFTQIYPLRFTPAGVPAFDATVEHLSSQEEAGVWRKAPLTLKVRAFGLLAEALAKQVIGTELQLQGFLANGRNGKGVVFHVQEFKLI